MKKTMLSVSVAVLCCGAYAADERADPAEHWNFDELSAVPACRDCPYPESRSEGLRALLVEGRGPDGTNAEFFAYYGYDFNVPALSRDDHIPYNEEAASLGMKPFNISDRGDYILICIGNLD